MPTALTFTQFATLIAYTPLRRKLPPHKEEEGRKPKEEPEEMPG